MEWLKKLFCIHLYFPADRVGPSAVYDYKYRKCHKCSSGQARGLASDGRFYWVKYDGSLKIKQNANDIGSQSH